MNRKDQSNCFAVVVMSALLWLTGCQQHTRSSSLANEPDGVDYVKACVIDKDKPFSHIYVRITNDINGNPTATYYDASNNAYPADITLQADGSVTFTAYGSKGRDSWGGEETVATFNFTTKQCAIKIIESADEENYYGKVVDKGSMPNY